MNIIIRPLCFSTALLVSAMSGAATVTNELQQRLDATGSFDPVAVILQFNDQKFNQRTLRQVRKSLRQQLNADARLTKAERKQLRKLLRSRVLKSLKLQLQAARQDLDPLLDFAAQGQIKDLWVINSVALTLPAYMVEALAQLPQVNSLRSDLQTAAPGQSYTPPSAPEWNVDSINVPPLWSQGITGDNVVVAVIDTGVDGGHPDLTGRFRGGSNDWLDLAGNSALPSDVIGHGTNVTGLILGGDSSGTAVGMAPNAQWIAARVFDSSGYSSLSNLHAALQWALDPDGNPNTDDAPDIVNNSWGLLETAGTCNTEFQSDIQTLKDSGIAVTFAAGNSGPGSNSSLSPANTPGTLSVGALDNTLTVAMTSSRGPSPCDTNAVFPTLSAPGMDVQTTGMTYGTGVPYTEWVGGTSFAVAHVSGVLALLKSAVPYATVEQMEQAMIETAVDIDQPGIDSNSGYGMLDAQAALTRLQQIARPSGPVNSAPVASSDQYNVDESTLLNVAAATGLLSNDSDADQDMLTAHLLTPPLHGTLTLSSDGSFTYQHNGGTLNDSFTYIANDGQNDSAETTVTLTIIPAPIVNTAPVAVNDLFRVKKNSTTVLNVLANDQDAENNIASSTLKIVRQPTKGGRVSINADGTVNYTPNYGFTGRDVFKYRVWDDQGLRSNTARVVVRVK
ncbi:S8 family serine peptidase [uncultured Amphritea sp.]|uniref:S8 family serine peptidase n=1 Tax=uncultured Amphritea sp. TaxID=981605 RepID=UPI0026278B74|nr:S8 family serine peptidase [uncultured Amphritea sp.]